MDCRIQIFLDNRWETAAVFEPDARTLERGIAGGGRLQYDIDYAEERGAHVAGASSVQGEAPNPDKPEMTND